MKHIAAKSGLVECLRKSGVIAGLTIDDAADAVPVARALLAGGVNVMELTLRTPSALVALKHIRAEVPEMLAGVGTVLRPDQIDEIVGAGAAFAVAPGMNPRVVAAARDAGLLFAPGVMTPSDIEAALEYDCRLLKFFPAETSGGLRHLHSMAAPYAHLGLEFIPLGGVNAQNAALYLASPLVTAIGGSWIASRSLIQKRDWQAITANAREVMAMVKQLRRNAC